MFYWAPNKTEAPKKFKQEDKDVRWVEIGNNVFMELEKTKDGKFIPLKQKKFDFGGGFERTLAVLNGLDDNYLSEVFFPIIRRIEIMSGKEYNESDETKSQ